MLPSDLFHHINPLLPDERSELERAWTIEKIVSRSKPLLEVGDVEKHLWFVSEGCFVILYENETTSVCVGLGYPGTLLTAFPSFIQQQPSKFRIIALARSKVVGITHQHLYRLIDQRPNIHNAWRVLLEQAITGLIEREVQYLNTTPAERLKSLYQRNPKVFQLFPQKYLASYLKIAPATLSRLKNYAW
ncbi:MAG TPA: hypothetical protein VGE26_10280 [Sphingobacteriaceae bacterium]